MNIQNIVYLNYFVFFPRFPSSIRQEIPLVVYLDPLIVLFHWPLTLRYNPQGLNSLQNKRKKSVSTDYVSTCFPQGGSPSPFDRIQGTRQATLAVNWLVEKIEQSRTFEGTFRLNTLSFSSWLSLKFRRCYFKDKHWNRWKCAFFRFISDLLSQVLQTTLLLYYVFDCAFQSLKRAFLQTSSQTSISLPTWSACTL